MTKGGVMDYTIPGVNVREPITTRAQAEEVFDSLLERLNKGSVGLHITRRTVCYRSHTTRDQIEFVWKDHLPQMDIDYTSLYVRDDVEFIVFRESGESEMSFGLLWEDTCIIVNSEALVSWLVPFKKRVFFKKKQAKLIKRIIERRVARLEALAL